MLSSHGEATVLHRGGVTPPAPMMLAQFDARVAETPDAVAVADDRSRRTYSQLDLESRAYSGLLLRNNVGREAVVAVVAERGPQYVAMILGVLRSGAAFMPVETSTPAARGRLMCATASVQAILVQPGHEGYASDLANGCCGERTTPILTAAATPAGAEMSGPPPERDNAGLAYVIFTSGSTGIPKGAMVTDGGINNHLAAKVRDLALGAGDVVGFTAPLAFDISIWQALNALCVGARVCVATKLNLSEPAELAAWVERHGVTILEIVPSFLAVVLDLLSGERLRCSLGSLRFMISTGEALPMQVARRWYESCPDIPLMNAYGPTECSDDVVHHVVTEAESRTKARPSIGREILNTDVYIVDDEGREAGNGVEGEMLIGGRGVGRGYIADPVRTALAFVPDYLSGRPGMRLYRTGDRGVRASDATLDYVGRRDRQVKVRGHRVELGDVESELLRLPGVAAAACVLMGDRIRAFVTLRPGTEELARGNAILAALRKSAPAYLAPQEVTVLDRLPSSVSGKVDYRALGSYQASAVGAETAANGEGLARLAMVRAMFTEILGIPEAADDEDFFLAGGDSLRAMRLLSLAQTRFGIQGALRGFLSNPTPRGLLAVLEAAENVPTPESGRPECAQPGALSSGQQRLWFLEQLHPRRGPQLLRLVLTLHGRLDLRALQHALNALVIRHEPLRTVFSQEVGVPVGTLWPCAQLMLRRASGEAGEAPADLMEKCGLSARTERPPLAATQVTEIAPDQHILTLVLHHLVADGWSLAVLGNDISTYYQRWIDGNPDVPLPPNSYSDYVAEERRWLASSDAAECTRYWREQLAGSPTTIDLPLDRPRPDRPDFVTSHVVCQLSADETATLVNTSRAMKATPFMAVMAAVYITLRELTGTDDLVVGIDAVNRSWTGSDRLVGTFVNQLPVRLACPAADPIFRDVLALARRQCLGAYEHERLPFHKIVAAVNPPRRAGRFPLFQVKVTHQGAWRSSLNLPGIRVTPAEISEPAIDLDLLLDVSGELDQLRLELVYRPEMMDHATAAAWVDAIGRTLRAGASQPDAAIEAFSTRPVRRSVAPGELLSWA
jgi:mycobactin peptide synthetase MbtE